MVLLDFFFRIRDAGIPVSVKEYLTLIEALQHRVASESVDNFYYLSRATFVKDEALYDRFDRAFGDYFNGLEALPDDFLKDIPEEWLKKQLELSLSEEDKKLIESLGGWDKLMETFKQRLEEQQKRHQGGSKWIGTAGKSPFGAYGYNPEGIRVGQQGSRNRRAVKVWDKREYRHLTDQVQLGTRNIKVALKPSQKFETQRAEEELDLDGTIRSTAKNAGYLDLKLVPERRNAIKVLLFFDIGGSMDDYVRSCEELFSAARTEFKHLEYFYFHNFIYESVWKDNRRRNNERIPISQILHKYSADYKVIVVGDATMSPYEITYPGGSVEHFNEEAGAVWLKRVLDVYAKVAWINPTPKARWKYHESISITRELVDDRMFGLTLSGLEKAMKQLAK